MKIFFLQPLYFKPLPFLSGSTLRSYFAIVRERIEYVLTSIIAFATHYINKFFHQGYPNKILYVSQLFFHFLSNATQYDYVGSLLLSKNTKIKHQHCVAFFFLNFVSEAFQLKSPIFLGILHQVFQIPFLFTYVVNMGYEVKNTKYDLIWVNRSKFIQ